MKNKLWMVFATTFALMLLVGISLLRSKSAQPQEQGFVMPPGFERSKTDPHLYVEKIPEAEKNSAYAFYRHVQQLQPDMSLADVDKSLGVGHTEIQNKLSYTLAVEEGNPHPGPKVQAMPQYEWKDRGSENMTVIEFDEHGMTSVLVKPYDENYAFRHTQHD